MIIICDFGGGLAQSLARQVRELGVYSEIMPYFKEDEMIKKEAKALILIGDDKKALELSHEKSMKKIYEMGLPILALGYGTPRMVMDLGGKIKEVAEVEKMQRILFSDNSPFLLSSDLSLCIDGGYLFKELPPGFENIAFSEDVPQVAIGSSKKNQYGFLIKHATEDILKTFLFDIAKIEKSWNLKDFAYRQIAKIRQQVGDKKVLCALSGGVDSSVAALIVHKAIGDQLTCIFVDHGLLRKGERQEVMENYGKSFSMDIRCVEAEKRFLGKLEGISDPEKKRKIIGEEFIRVFEEEANKIGDIDFLVQGTIYPDVVESGEGASANIKSHHNVGGLPERMDLKLIEPLRELFKDEVREVGEILGLEHHFVWRQPFPGPGLAVRCLGAITKKRLDILSEADAIFREEIARAGLEEKIWQYFAVLPGISSVGVKDQARTYFETIALRAVHSVDGTSSDWARIPYETLEIVSRRIVSEVPGVNRVVYDITTKPPSTIEWE
ncbi:MAG TPA: glutamine-hydrolyzing GMP synthase [Clostridia bacterium]|nr:glutamine-hydrolyzing GMP synthase [Clostridia bacterium]